MTVQRKTQVLIVDDYPTNIKVLSDLLIEYGFEVLIARDGENALQKLHRISPDLILLDVLMPGIDGFETCRRLKAQESTRDIPVIFMTALADPVDKIKGLTLGAVDYITKPFQQEEVLARVNAHLKLRYLTKQLEEQNARLQEEARSRQIAESALRFSEEKFAKAFRSNPGPMLILTLEEGRFIDVNQNFCKILGCPPEVVLGKTLDELPLYMNQEERDRFRTTLHTEGVVHNQECQVHTHSGELRNLLVSAEVVQVRGLDCILAMALDVTACKQATAELQQAKAKADLANRAKSQFLANISHELRSPLNTILGYTQLIGRDPALTSEQQEHLSIINRSSDHLLTLINDVLEMAKIEAGQLTLHKTAFDINHLLGVLHDMLAPRVRTKAVQFKVDCDPEVPPYLWADATKLRQVLINIVGNSLKFTQQGQVKLHVSLGKFEEASTRVSLHFAVEDTGPGIAPEEIGALFDPFTQTETGRQLQEGTGLGLPISQQFVQLMGGNITVQSQVGVGSFFSFEIPVELADAAQVDASQPRQRVVGLVEGQPSYRILVVDDQVTNRQFLVKLLASIGFEVKSAANGEDAIAQVQQWQPHLIWLDMRMPGMDGCAVTRQIRQLKNYSTIPKIIALTANAFEEDRLAALAAGCDDFVRKPIREELLFEKMSEHLGVTYVFQGLASRPPASEVEKPQNRSLGKVPFVLEQTTLDELWDLADGDEAFLADYLNSHLEQLPQLMQSVQTAIEQQNPQALSLAAHTLKGMGMTFGAQQFISLSLTIEQAAKAGITTVSPTQLQAFEIELNRLMTAIKREREKLQLNSSIQ
ncbi:MAG TPA: response regulator [Leptolyngbyaceae cyanobacterium]